jgi:zinc transporter ZupT
MHAAPSVFAALGLLAVHLVAPRLRFLDVTPRSIWLSIAGGISIAYVFVHVLPELSEGQKAVVAALKSDLGYVEHHVYLVALAGLASFYGLERLALSSRRRSRAAGEPDRTTPMVFWIHMASFAVYNMLIGYLLLHREDPSLTGLGIFFVAMAVHFVVTDHGLREHHKEDFVRLGRYVLAVAVAAGWVIGLLTQVSKALIAVLFAFLAGGVVLNVLKEELPEQRQSRFWAFLVGTLAYTSLLLAL